MGWRRSSTAFEVAWRPAGAEAFEVCAGTESYAAGFLALFEGTVVVGFDAWVFKVEWVSFWLGHCGTVGDV